MTVAVQIACRDETPGADAIAGWAKAALAGDRRALCLRIVGEREGAGLNARFRNRHRATNVLAFPADGTDGTTKGERASTAKGDFGLLGDIAICAPVAAREARQQRKVLADHYAHLVVHGVLHLLGMDHRTVDGAKVMEAKEAALLKRFGISDPYGTDE